MVQVCNTSAGGTEEEERGQRGEGGGWEERGQRERVGVANSIGGTERGGDRR